METKEYRLKQVTEKITKGTTPSNIGESFTEEGIMYFRSELIGKSKYIDKSDGLLFISNETHEKLKRSQIQKNDLLFSMAGIYLGKISLVGDEDFPANTNQAVAIIRFNSKEIDLEYVYYYMTQRWYNIYINSLTAQAAQPNINLEQIGNLKLNLPPLPTQQKIASILSAYDNLIQNYKKQIEALQTAANELYKEWFVRFRFPGWQNAKFENGIPEGWKIVRVGDYVKIKSGFAFKSEWWQDEGCPVVKIKDIDNGEIVITDLDFVSEEHTKKAKSFLLNEGDLVIAMTGATIGKIGLAPKIKNLYTNQRVGKFFLPENPFETMPFLYCLFSQNSTVETILCLSGASSAQPNISPDQLESIKFFFNEDIVFQFNKKSAPFFRKILKLREQITNLTQQRDLLLPRLMSGKLEV